MDLKRDAIQYSVYLAALLLLALAVPLSNFLLSIGGILLSLNWLLSGSWRRKWERLKERPAALGIASFFLACAVSLFYTGHWNEGIANLLNKLPLLYAPIILASSDPLQGKEQRAVVNAFLGGVFIGTVASYFHGFFLSAGDLRNLSPFISHIRFSLCLDLAVCFSLYMGIKGKSYSLPSRISYGILAAWFLTYLFFAQTLTGIAILLLLLLFTLLHVLKSRKIPRKRWIIATCFSLLFFSLLYFFIVIKNYYTPREQEGALAEYTRQGNRYQQDTLSIVENGHRIGMYVCAPELREQWEKRSAKPYDAAIEATLIRYLNSKGFRKDAEGVEALSPQEIANVEKGIANADYVGGVGIKRALYPILFSFSLYNHYGKIEYSTVLQRFELWKAGVATCRKHPWTGVGIGSHKPQLDLQLEKMGSPLTYKKNMGAHNQFITYGLMGGIFLTLYFIATLFLPFFKVENSRLFLYRLFFIIIFFSLFTEDTLETQVGVSLYAIFNAFLLFVFDKEQFEKGGCYLSKSEKL